MNLLIILSIIYIIVIILLFIYFIYCRNKIRNIDSSKGNFNDPNNIENSEDKRIILEQFYDQWKEREDHLWSNIYRVFYALILVLFLPFAGRFLSMGLNKDLSNILSNFFANIRIWYLVIGIILSVIYLLIGILYTIRLRSAKKTYDLMIENVYKFKRVTVEDIGGKLAKIPVNPLLVFIQYSVLFVEIFFVYSMCF